MRAKISATVAGLALAGIAVMAVQSRADERDRSGARDAGSTARCVSTPLKGSRVIDERTIVVDDWHGNAAVLGLTGPCLDKHTFGVRIKLVGIQDEICRPDDVDAVADTSPGAMGVCAVRSVELMSRADAENRAPGRGAW